MNTQSLNTLRELLIREIRQRKPDANSPDVGVDQATVDWLARVVDRWFADKINYDSIQPTSAIGIAAAHLARQVETDLGTKNGVTALYQQLVAVCEQHAREQQS